ncbi:hypothetical protein [Streptomyces sp. NPDC087300]|uniref:hypothetical protein n=1 Tax=Streptomyces sp. NPDC087300 TaxID=3365780 RepID=UPI003822922B
MSPNAEQHTTRRQVEDVDFGAICRAVACARATPPPPRNDDILFTGGESPYPSVADQIKELLAGLPPLLTVCQDAVAAWEPVVRQMTLRLIQDGHDLVERRPFAPNAEQAHAYLQQLARDTAAFAAIAYRR